MTTTTSLIPEGKDFLANLTVAELDMASRRVGANIGEAVDNEHRWAAFAVLADIWARRTGDERREADFKALEAGDLLKLLGLDDDQTPDPGPGAGGAVGETDPSEFTANPTDSAPASS